MNKRIDCGHIVHNGKSYKVEWEPNTLLVWAVDDKGYSKNYGNASCESESDALNMARQMLKSSGL